MKSLSLSRLAAIAVVLAVSVPAAAQAQDEMGTYPASTIIVSNADGTQSEFMVSDLSVYLSTSPAYDDVPATTDFSFSMTVLSPLDATLLQWAAQTGDAEAGSRDVEIVASVPGLKGPKGDDRELRYEITGAHVTSFSVSHSTYAPGTVSLSLSAGKLVMDGVAMN